MGNARPQVLRDGKLIRTDGNPCITFPALCRSYLKATHCSSLAHVLPLLRTVPLCGFRLPYAVCIQQTVRALRTLWKDSAA